MCKSALNVLNELLRRIINCKRGDTNLKRGDKIANEEIKQSEMYIMYTILKLNFRTNFYYMYVPTTRKILLID